MYYGQLLSTFSLVALIGVIAAIGGAWIAAATVGIICYRGRKKGMKIIVAPNTVFCSACMYSLLVAIASVVCPINIAHEFGGLFINLLCYVILSMSCLSIHALLDAYLHGSVCWN